MSPGGRLGEFVFDGMTPYNLNLIESYLVESIEYFKRKRYQDQNPIAFLRFAPLLYAGALRPSPIDRATDTPFAHDSQ